VKILIADDQAVSRELMVKMLTGIGNIEVFATGQEAVKSFERALEASEPFQLMILDVSMPGMSGIDLLKSVRSFEHKHKIKKPDQVKVLMLTSYSDKETVISCYMAGCDDYAIKPFNSHVFIEKIKKLGFTLDSSSTAKVIKETAQTEKSMGMLVTDAIEGFKKGNVDLPSPPHIIQPLQDIINTHNSSASDMANLIEKDTAISIKLIIAANYPLYGVVDKIKDVKTAINTLGVNVTQSIVSAIAKKALYETKHPLIKTLMDKIWLHSLATAYCAREISKKISSVGYEKAYVKGLIHDIGGTLLIKNIGESITGTAHINIDELLTAVFEVHSSFGAALLQKWKFSQDFIDVANMHEWNQYNEKTDKEVLIVNLADLLAYKIGYGFFTKELTEFSDMQSATLLKLNDSDLALICQKAEKSITDSEGLFAIM